MHDERTYAARALSAGALGYVSKQAPTEEILQAIRTVRSGRVYLSDEMTQRLLQRSVGSGLAPGSSTLDLLSDRELEVFRQIGQGYSTKQIAGRLGLATTTIETYRERLKTKLNLANGSELRQQAMHWVMLDH